MVTSGFTPAQINTFVYSITMLVENNESTHQGSLSRRWLSRFLRPLIILPKEGKPQQRVLQEQPKFTYHSHHQDKLYHNKKKNASESDRPRRRDRICCFRRPKGQRKNNDDSSVNQLQKSSKLQKTVEKNVAFARSDNEVYLPSNVTTKFGVNKAPPRVIVDPIEPDRSVIIRYYVVDDDVDEEEYEETGDNDECSITTHFKANWKATVQSVLSKSGSSSSQSVALPSSSEQMIPRVRSFYVDNHRIEYDGSAISNFDPRTLIRSEHPLLEASWRRLDIRSRILTQYLEQHCKSQFVLQGSKEQMSAVETETDAEEESDLGGDLDLNLNLRHINTTYDDAEKLRRLEQRRRNWIISNHPEFKIPHDLHYDIVKRKITDHAWTHNGNKRIN